jgi:excisionase family DNA binding protein
MKPKITEFPKRKSDLARTTAEDLVADGLSTVPEGQSFTRLSRAKLYDLMAHGKLPFVLIGRRRLIPRRALVELAARQLRGVS